MPTRGRKEVSKRALLADVEQALLDALAESPAMQRSLWRLQREGWVLRLHLDCQREPGEAPEEDIRAPRMRQRETLVREATEPAFRIDAGDLRFLRSIGIDPTRKRRPRRSR